MLKQLMRAFANKLLGQDTLLRNIVYKEFSGKNYLTAAALTIYSLPIRKFINFPYSGRIKFIADKDYYRKIHELMHISKVDGFDLVRMGRDNDGGYIMLNDFNNGGIAYSFGISNDVSWDKDMAMRGYDVFMYDHTIEKLPEENSRFHFFRQGISDGITHDERLKTLEYLIKQNKHENKHDMILKMDVEGAEWGFFENVSSEVLSQFSQILLEFHGFQSKSIYRRIPAVLRKINETHKLVHLHGQNIGNYIFLGGKNFCDQIEASYVLRSKYKFTDNYNVKLPLNIDMPARPYIPEVILGSWNDEIKPDDEFMQLTSVFY